MSEREAEQIAANLTVEQRYDLLACYQTHHGWTVPRACNDSIPKALSTTLMNTPPDYLVLNKKGEAVRQHLQEQSNDK